MSVEARHTPGPWVVKPSKVSGNRCIYSDGEGGYGIGEAWNLNGEPQNEANAHLIAAAPELLEVVRELKELFRFALLGTTPDIAREGMEFIRKAEYAIAKAENQSSEAPSRRDEL